MSQLILPLRVEELPGAVVVRFGNEHFRGAAQVLALARFLDKLLHRRDAVLLEHYHQHLRVDHRPGVKQLHAPFSTAARCCTNCAMMLTAISWTLTASIGSPTGHATRCNCSSVAIFSSRKRLKIKRFLRLLPIIPKKANGRWIHSRSTNASCWCPRVTISPNVGRAGNGCWRSLSHASTRNAVHAGK